MTDGRGVVVEFAASASARTDGSHIGASRKAATDDTHRHPGSFSIGQCDRLVGERAGRIYFFEPGAVDFIEADGNYVHLHVGSERYINRDSLTRLAELLENCGFVRISRAVLINLQRVSYAEREGQAVLAFVLHSGGRVVSGAGYRLKSGAHLRIARTRGVRRKSEAHHRAMPLRKDPD